MWTYQRIVVDNRLSRQALSEVWVPNAVKSSLRKVKWSLLCSVKERGLGLGDDCHGLPVAGSGGRGGGPAGGRWAAQAAGGGFAIGSEY